MTDEKLKKQIGTNIANLRKRQGLTQAGLGDKLNYSDKAVSKWERGESAPDVLTLVSIAELFKVTVDDLLRDPNALPENTGAVQQVMGQVLEKTLKRKVDKRIIVQLSSLLVWFLALCAFVLLTIFQVPNGWLGFFLAIPTDAVVVLSLRSAWKDFRSNRMLISVLMWSCLLNLCLFPFVLFGVHLWMLLLLGIPGQISILLWFRLIRSIRNTEVKNGQERAEKKDP